MLRRFGSTLSGRRIEQRLAAVEQAEATWAAEQNIATVWPEIVAAPIPDTRKTCPSCKASVPTAANGLIVGLHPRGDGFSGSCKYVDFVPTKRS